MSARSSQSEAAAVQHWVAEVSKAAASFERRWTEAALRRVDPDLAKRFFDQRQLFDRATITGSSQDVETHGAAMCRGYGACIRALEAAAEPDDAYILGLCHRSGFRVAIGHQRASAERVAELHGRAVCWMSADEVAAIMASIEGFKAISTVKRWFPGAEILDFHPNEPAKADGEAAA